MKLSFKIISLILVALLTVLIVFSYFFIKEGKDNYLYMLNEQGRSLSYAISSASVEILLVDDYPVLDSYIQNIADKYPTIVGIEIIKEDKIVSRIDKNHLNTESIHIFTSDIKVDDDLIGIVKLSISSAITDKKVDNRIKQLIMLVIITFIILFIFFVSIIDYFLISKIQDIIKHTKLIGKGVYDKNITFNTNDEFKELANSINNMAANIQESHKNFEESNKKLVFKTKELTKSNHYKNIFLANMSHELKTPLNSINTISEIMARDSKHDLKDEQIKNLTIINNCGKDLLYLINDILDISKLEAGEMTLRLESMDILEVLNNIKDMFIHQANKQNLELTFKYDSNIRTIYSDKEKIKQIVKNLLSNAIKFTDKGKVRLRLEDNNRNIIITIKDDGIGIPENKLLHIFNRFKQVDDSTTRKHSGTGLGLSICKELSNLLGGYISVHSKIGLGSTFIVNIPKKTSKEHIGLDKVKIIYADEINTEKTIEDIKPVVNKIQKVLLFNSDPVSLFSITVALKKSNKEIVTANTIVDIFKIIEDEEFDFLVVDTNNDTIDFSSLSKKTKEKDIKLIGFGDDKVNNNLHLDLLISKSTSADEFVNKINIL